MQNKKIIIITFPLAVAESDYSSFFIDKIFMSGSRSESAECINITITEDDVLEGSQTFIVLLSTFDRNVIITGNSTVITILDDDG